jgi:hypothetical protein
MRRKCPGRARDADQRSGDFKAGHPKRGGRQKGTRNLFSPDVKKALLEAPSRLGFDGSGQDGLSGYLARMAMEHPDAFGREILLPMLSGQLLEELRRAKHQLADSADEPLPTAAELDQRVRQFIGTRTDGTGQTMTTDPRLADSADHPPATAAELDQWVRQYVGKRTAGAGQTMTTAPGPRVAEAGTDTLMHLAVGAPRLFCQALGEACLPVPKNRPRRD